MFRRRKLKTFQDLTVMKENLGANQRIVWSCDELIARYKNDTTGEPDMVNVAFVGTSFQLPRKDILQVLDFVRRQAIERREAVMTEFARIGVQP